MLEVSGVPNTALAAHMFTYTVTDQDGNTASATLTLRIDEQPSISVAAREFMVSDRSIRFGDGGISFSSLVTSSHTPHGEFVGIGIGDEPPAPDDSRFIRQGSGRFPGFVEFIDYIFNTGFAGSRSTQFTIGVYATDASIRAAIIPPMNTNGDLARARDLLVSETATVTFIIPNTAPVITPPNVPTYLLNEAISLIFTADDENGHPVTFSLAAGAGAVPTGAAIAPIEHKPSRSTPPHWTTLHAGTFA